MMSDAFSAETFGKWILTGEHAVLRGAPALVFPLREKKMQFFFKDRGTPFDLKFFGSRGKEVEILSWALIERLFKFLRVNRSLLKGTLEIHSELPVGAGLGASAALCAGMAHWAVHQGWASDHEKYSLARYLEDLFHGESSGVDVAVALSGTGLRFLREGERVQINPVWEPLLFLSYSGIRGVTSECVSKVKAQIDQNKELGAKIDRRMGEATEIAEQALMLSDQSRNKNLLCHAMDLAHQCFEDWNLIPQEMHQHLTALKSHGAIATKPTGSGGGGFVLSFWPEPPGFQLMDQLKLVQVGF